VTTAELDVSPPALLKVEDIPSGNWFQHAVCADKRSLFFAGPGERPERRAKREVKAKRICAVCPVRLICRDSGREQREHGVWGGETEAERAALGFLPRRASRRLLEERNDEQLEARL